MKIQKLNISFAKYSDANLLTKAEGICLSMADPAFASLAAMLAIFQSTVDTYGAALNAATDRSRNNVALKNQWRATLETALMQLASAVMSLANGDVTILMLSGFTLSKDRSPVYITNPGAVTLSNGITSGELQSTVPTVPGTRIYFHQITPEPLTDTSNWQSNPSSKSKYTFTDLEAGKKYWVRAAVVGTDGQLAYGPASAQFVQ